MPTFHSTSRLKASSDNWSVSLDVRHVIIAGTPSSPSILLKQPSSLTFDVCPPPSFPIVLAGSINGEPVPLKGVKVSGVGELVRGCLKELAEDLGISGVSHWYADEEDEGKNKLLLHCRHRSLDPVPKATLSRIYLTFNWTSRDASYPSHSIGDEAEAAKNPFSKSLYMPLRILLSGLMDRFMSTQLVIRYPLIFGRWRQKLDDESNFFAPFLSSLRGIVDIVQDDEFKSQCEQYSRKIARQRTKYIAEKNAILRRTDDEEEVGDEEQLFWALQRLFVNGAKRVLPRKISHTPDPSSDALEYDTGSGALSSPAFMSLDDTEESTSLGWSDVSSNSDTELLTSDGAYSEFTTAPLVKDYRWGTGAPDEVIPPVPRDPFYFDEKEISDSIWHDEWLDDEDLGEIMIESEGDDIVGESELVDSNLDMLWDD